MATAQFVVYNDAGIEQVSFGGVNLALVAKVVLNSISLWTATSGPLQSGLKYSFSVNAVKPVVAIASDKSGASGAVFATCTNTGANQWRVDLWGGATVTSGTSAPGANTLSANVTAYVFDEAPAPAAGTFGMVLFDAAGKCTFNSNYPAARIVGLVTPNQSTHNYNALTPPSGRTYATVQRSTCGQQIIGNRNASSGDRLANTYGYGVSGGMSGAAVSFGPTASVSATTVGYNSCFVAGVTVSIAGSAGGPGGVGNIYTTFGCRYTPSGSFTRYFSDGLVLDVTGF